MFAWLVKTDRKRSISSPMVAILRVWPFSFSLSTALLLFDGPLLFFFGAEETYEDKHLVMLDTAEDSGSSDVLYGSIENRRLVNLLSQLIASPLAHPHLHLLRLLRAVV